VLGGTVKRRFAALAARYANEVNTLGAPNDELGERKARLDHACVEAGRDPATLGFSVMTACFLGESDAEVRERVARFAALRGDGTDPESLVAERRDRWLVGTVEQVAERIDGLRELGVTRVLLQHLNHHDDAMIGLMPAVSR
jgi:alkanesulfonate monooxygenase SsuD/methylene tetrahydromethanopterin reductase-like flavin-dependent oxidoreductase (luciferase family)